jgi:uncharacterized protein YcgI (DUF1989 family)
LFFFRREAHLANGDQIINRLIAGHSIYIPIIPTIQALFQDANYAGKLLNEKKSKPTGRILHKFHRRHFLQTTQLVSDGSKVSLRFQILYDGVGMMNCLRGHSAGNSIGVFYFIIENLPKCYNTCHQNVHVFALCHVTDLKKHGFHPILRSFMEDIKEF